MYFENIYMVHMHTREKANQRQPLRGWRSCSQSLLFSDSMASIGALKFLLFLLLCLLNYPPLSQGLLHLIIYIYIYTLNTFYISILYTSFLCIFYSFHFQHICYNLKAFFCAIYFTGLECHVIDDRQNVHFPNTYKNRFCYVLWW